MEVSNPHHILALLSPENSPRYEWISVCFGPEVFGGKKRKKSLACAGIRNPDRQALVLVSLPTMLFRSLRISMTKV